ncbi:MAG: energy-coupling factor transporter transmembrane protein EcfT [Lactobacillaceae bacterium]|jgi:energy-coupling factor transport system permease protein|nr:energy-coupling factor transporter transmembrane protein EcfT [Lactobacillaceae bacterium]
MKPAIRFLIFFIIGIELAFSQSIIFNALVIVVTLIYLAIIKASFKRVFLLMLIGILPAISSWIIYTQLTITNNISLPIVMTMRVYSYILIGLASISQGTMTELIRSFEQDLKMPSTLAYGSLGALNFIPKISQQIKIIKTNSKMRGEKLTGLSPKLYVRAIYAAFNWSENLSQAIYAHGFKEKQKRTHYGYQKISSREWLIFSVIVVATILISVLKY